jgi:hypothetical protein
LKRGDCPCGIRKTREETYEASCAHIKSNGIRLISPIVFDPPSDGWSTAYFLLIRESELSRVDVTYELNPIGEHGVSSVGVYDVEVDRALIERGISFIEMGVEVGFNHRHRSLLSYPINIP